MAGWLSPLTHLLAANATPATTRQLTNVDTVQPIVPGPLEPPVVRRRAPALVWWAIGAVIAVVAATLITASLVKVPYVVISPGATYATNDRVTIGGGQRVYPPKGTIDFVTVSEKTDVSALERFIADRDPDSIVSPTKEQLGTRSPKQDAAFNQLLMRSSKDTAALVALKKLGYTVPVKTIGAVVVDVTPGSAAEHSGLLPGDSVTAVDGAAVATGQAVRDNLGAHKPGDHVTLTIQEQQGPPKTVPVTLGSRADKPGAGFLGVATQDLGIPDLPFPVDVRSDDVGGPSAGLAFALAIVDALTPGELTGGGTVAVTGEIEPDGTVGPIGGIQQKVVAVEHAHIPVFLVPADHDCGKPDGSCNFTDATRKAHGKIKVVAVSTLDDALNALTQLGGNGNALASLASSSSDSSTS